MLYCLPRGGVLSVAFRCQDAIRLPVVSDSDVSGYEEPEQRERHRNRSRAETSSMKKSLKCGLREDGIHVFYCNRTRFRL